MVVLLGNPMLPCQHQRVGPSRPRHLWCCGLSLAAYCSPVPASVLPLRPNFASLNSGLFHLSNPWTVSIASLFSPSLNRRQGSSRQYKLCLVTLLVRHRRPQPYVRLHRLPPPLAAIVLLAAGSIMATASYQLATAAPSAAWRISAAAVV